MNLNFTFVIFTLSFIIFLGIMKLVFFDRLKKIIGQREKFIQDNLNLAHQAARKAQAELKDSNASDILAKARVQAQGFISKAIEEANNQKQKLLDDSHQQIENKISTELETIKDEKNSLMASLDNQVQEIVNFTLDKFYTELGDKAVVAA